MQHNHPHISHQEPWAHAFICCDQPHDASTSFPVIDINPHPHLHVHQHVHGHGNTYGTVPSNTGTLPNLSNQTCQGMDSPCFMEMYCCADDYCDHVECGHEIVNSECCGDGECGAAITGRCEGGVSTGDTIGKVGNGVVGDGGGHQHDHVDCHDHDPDLAELERWACSKEGCHAIQQYLECCAQTDCNLPICTNTPSHPHPPIDPFAQLLANPQSNSNPIPNSNSWVLPDLSQNHAPPSSLPLPTHICHWQNCHRIFHSMPDLLGHVAADHLGASGFNANPPQPPQQPQQPQQTINTAPVTYTPVGQQLIPSQQLLTPDLGTLTPQQQQESDHLLACLWDDCFPSIPDSTTSINFPPNAQQLPATECQDHLTMAAHLPPHVHAHSTASGEPFSPSTMLRHVLEDHLGVPGEIVGWGPDTSTLALAPLTQPSVDKIPAIHHHHHHHHHLPTPPSSTASHRYNNSPTPTLSDGKPLHCLWPNCTHEETFNTPADLMEHVADKHIGKGKDSYTCLWDGCGGDAKGRVFKSRQKVLRHLQSHTGHRPYVCDECGQAFSEAAPLAAHLRRHSQEKPFVCDHPGCGKTFAISSSLTIHMRTHNGDKPFVCPYCQKGFVEASNLTKHIRTHTGEKPFVCSFAGCNKRFPRPDQLKRHMAIHDVDRPGRKVKAVTGRVEVAA